MFVSLFSCCAVDLNIGQDPSVEVDEECIPLPNITERSMEKIIEWCQQHKNDPAPPEGEEDFTFNDQIDDWDKEFLRMDDGSLFDLILVCSVFQIHFFKLHNICLWLTEH